MSGERATDGTLRDRLEQDRLRHRAARLDRVLVALRARARAYEEAPSALRLALSDFEAELESARARIDADGSPSPRPVTRRTTGRPDAAQR